MLGVGQRVAQHHWLPDLSTLNSNLLLPLPGHVTLQLLQKRCERALHFTLHGHTSFKKSWISS